MKARTRSRRRPHTLVVPKGFDPKVHLDPGLMRYDDHARYVLDRIFWRRKHERLSPDGMVRLKTAYLGKFFPDHKVVRTVLDSMERNGALQIVKGEKPAGPGRPGRCRGYKPTPELLKVGYVNHTPTNKSLLKRLDRKRNARDRLLRPIHRHLVSHLNTVEFDLEGARRAVLDHHEQSPLVRGKDSQLRERDVAAALVLLDRFSAGGHDPIVDDYGRFHCGLSSLPSVARSCPTCNGQPLVFLDIACSQPCFLGLLYLAFVGRPGYFDNWKRLKAPEDYLKFEIDGEFLSNLSNSSLQLSSCDGISNSNTNQEPEIHEEEGKGRE